MILTKPTPWGIIWGKLSTTPEQAKRMFGFDQHPDAIGIVIRRHRTKKGKLQLVVGNLFKPKENKSPKRMASRNLLSILSKIAKQEKNTLVNKTIWKPNKPTKCPHNTFIGANIARIQKGTNYNWENMLITRGILYPPIIKKATYHPSDNTLHIPELNENMGIVVFDTKTLKFFHSPPPNKNKFHIPDSYSKEKLHSPIIYVYIRENDNYSKSVSIVPEVK